LYAKTAKARCPPASSEGEADPSASAEALRCRAGGGQALGALHNLIGPDESGFSLCSNSSIDGTKIFINRKDREDFLERLAGFK